MRPFAFVGSETIGPAIVVDEAERAAKLKRDVEFFAERGIAVAEQEINMALPTTSPVTKSTETTIPAQDSDERTFDTLDD